jgi:hypothetical protein
MLQLVRQRPKLARHGQQAKKALAAWQNVVWVS